MKNEMPELPIKQWKEGITVEPGFYYLGMPNEVYHALEGDSKSSLDILNDDPYKYFNRKERETTRNMEMGTAIHAAMLEPKAFAEDFIMLPTISDRRQPEYKNASKAVGKSNVFVGKECEKIEGMQKAIKANDEAQRLLDLPGYFEISGVAIDPETGLIIRHRFDKLAWDGRQWIGVDLKKTTKVDDYSFSKKIYDLRYHVQDSLYRHGFELITGQEMRSFQFVAIEEDYPHLVAIYELCDMSKKIGFDEYRYDMATLKQYKEGQQMAHNNRGRALISLPEFIMREHDVL